MLINVNPVLNVAKTVLVVIIMVVMGHPLVKLVMMGIFCLGIKSVINVMIKNVLLAVVIQLVLCLVIVVVVLVIKQEPV